MWNRIASPSSKFVVLLPAAACCLLAVEAGCQSPERESVASIGSPLDQNDCAEYGGTWTNGKCTLPGGTNVVTVTPEDPEPIQVWTGPLPGSEFPWPGHEDPPDNGGDPDPGGVGDPGPSEEPTVCSGSEQMTKDATGDDSADYRKAVWSAEVKAKVAVEEACTKSTRFCTATPSNTTSWVPLDECWTTFDNTWMCRARGLTRCTYSYPW